MKQILNCPRAKAQCFGTFLGIRRGYSGSPSAAEHTSFGNAVLGRLRVLGFPGLRANETLPLGEGLKVTESKGPGAESLHSCLGVCAHLLGGIAPRQWVCWAPSGHGRSSGEDVEENLTMCTE